MQSPAGHCVVLMRPVFLRSPIFLNFEKWVIKPLFPSPIQLYLCDSLPVRSQDKDKGYLFGGYARYIAALPHAEHPGDHRLLGDEDGVNLDKATARENLPGRFRCKVPAHRGPLKKSPHFRSTQSTEFSECRRKRKIV